MNEPSSLVVVSSCPKAPMAKKRMVMNEVRVVNFMMVVLEEVVVVGYDVVDRRTDRCLIYTVPRSIRGVCGASNENKRGANEA